MYLFWRMRNLLFIIGLFLLLGCTKGHKYEDLFEITVSSWKDGLNDRNGADYVKLWVNDTLLFSDTFHVRYNYCIRETRSYFRMETATLHKMNRDSVKLRIRFITLDSVLFGSRHAVDTTFWYRIDNIPYLNIDFYRQLIFILVNRKNRTVRQSFFQTDMGEMNIFNNTRIQRTGK